jgi:iron complex outermembrane receptor protein
MSPARRAFARVALIALMPAALAAQEEASPAAESTPAAAPASGPIEQITITAERRESTVQDTPISVSAFDAEALRAQGIVDPADLHSHVPGLFYTEGGGGSPITQIAVRGVGNENVTAGGDPGVAYHFDGVYLGRPTAAATDFFDLERVEVLRGPQGTLYGRNATGGSINVISQKPTDEWDALADFSYGNYDALRVRAAGGGPITDWLKVRVAGVRQKHDGYLNNIADDSFCSGECNDTDEQDTWGMRLHVLLEPTESTDVLFTMQYHWDDGAVGQVRLDDVSFSPLGNPSDRRDIRNDLDSTLDMEAKLYTLRVDQDLDALLGGMHLSAFISRQEQDWTQVVDNDFTELPFAYTEWTEPSDQWVGEIQLASANDSAFQWLFGFFAMREDVGMDFLFYDVNPAVFAFRFQNGGDITTHSYAVFGEGSYDFDPFTVRLGLRWSTDEKKGDDFLSFTAPWPGPPIAPAFPGAIDDDWQRLTGRLVGEYRPMENVMLYASVSKGYKSGGLLIGNREPATGLPNVYDPEDIWAYEAGVKATLLEGRLQTNLAAFYNDYDDLQVFILIGQSAVVENAAKAKVSGLELEATAVPIDHLQIDLGLAFTHAYYSEYTSTDPVPPPFGGSPDSNQRGNQLNRVPDFVANVGMQYEIPFFGSSTLTPRVDWHYQSESFYRPYNMERDRSPAWDRWEVRLAWEGPETDFGQFSAELFMKNIEDNDHIMNISTGAVSELWPAQGILHAPRTYGFTLGWKY